MVCNSDECNIWPVVQVGLAEMQTAVEQTGGLLVQASTFTAQAFKESFRRIFAPASEEGHLGMNSNAQFEVCLLPSNVVPCLSCCKQPLGRSSRAYELAPVQLGLQWYVHSIALQSTA